MLLKNIAKQFSKLPNNQLFAIRFTKIKIGNSDHRHLAVSLLLRHFSLQTFS